MQDLLAAQKTGLDYLQRLILKSRKDFSSNAMLYISETVGLPHLANPPPGMMVPSIPQSYIDKCVTDLSKLSTFYVDGQASLYSKVRFFMFFFLPLYSAFHVAQHSCRN